MLLKHFCSRWTSKYLTELRENQRQSNRNKTLILPKVNDVVLIKDIIINGRIRFTEFI